MFKLVVLLSVAAMAMAKPSVLAPVAYSAVVPAVSSVSQYSSSVSHGVPAVYTSPAFYSAPVYGAPAVVPAVGALAQAPHQPAVVLDPVNGVPLDTPEVVAARAAHYTAKALAPYHHLHKRSVVAPVSYASVVSPISYTSPVVSTYSAPLVTGYPGLYSRAFSFHPY